MPVAAVRPTLLLWEMGRVPVALSSPLLSSPPGAARPGGRGGGGGGGGGGGAGAGGGVSVWVGVYEP
jgi:hypothetical protein